mmetsp:Transcript_25104/g.69241  ORF Transcript_25104/g.69241 Transcript_25104/m.69241 type:complete len:294 (-) Transcript_25104:1685-2566(-)
MVRVLHDQRLGTQSLGYTPSVGIVPHEFAQIEEADRQRLAHLVVATAIVLVVVPGCLPHLAQSIVIHGPPAAPEGPARGVLVENGQETLDERKVSLLHPDRVGPEKVRFVEEIVPSQDAGADPCLVDLPLRPLGGAFGQQFLQEFQVILQVGIVPPPQPDGFEGLGDAAADHVSDKGRPFVAVAAIAGVFIAAEGRQGTKTRQGQSEDLFAGGRFQEMRQRRNGTVTRKSLPEVLVAGTIQRHAPQAKNEIVYLLNGSRRLSLERKWGGGGGGGGRGKRLPDHTIGGEHRRIR